MSTRTLAAARTHALGLRQFVMPGFAGQVVRQAAAAVRPAPTPGLRRRCSLRSVEPSPGRGHLGEEQELVGIEAFAARPVQAPQQQVEPVPQRLVVAVALCSEASSSRTMRLSVATSSGKCSAVTAVGSSRGCREAHAY